MFRFLKYLTNTTLAVFTIFFCLMANAQETNRNKTDITIKKLSIDNLNFTGENLNITNKTGESDKNKDSFRIQADKIVINKEQLSIILQGKARINFKAQEITGNELSLNNLNPEFIGLFESAIGKNSIMKKTGW